MSLMLTIIWVLINEFKYDMECFSGNNDTKEILGGLKINQSDR